MQTIKLRYKPIKEGKMLSAYIDFYPEIIHPETGKKTRRHFLKYHIYKVKRTAAQIRHNEVFEKKIEEAYKDWVVRIQSPTITEEFERERQRKEELAKSSFIDYFNGLRDKRTGSALETWKSTSSYLQKFAQEQYGGNIFFSDVNLQMLDGFKTFLMNTKGIRSTQKRLHINTAAFYLIIMKTAINHAYRFGKIRENFTTQVGPIDKIDPQVEYLTRDEVKLLVKTDCKIPLIKRAALFSAMTGLRFSDIELLTWREVSTRIGEGTFLSIRVKKSKRMLYLPISDEATEFIGEKGQPDEHLFPGLFYSNLIGKTVDEWVRAAGINRRITFHAFRHTYAVLQIDAGTDLYTLSKLMGHSSIMVTEDRYAKLLISKKREAANRVSIFS